MGKLKQLTQEEATARFDWLQEGVASIELDVAVGNALWAGAADAVDAKVIEKLHEISRVAREVASYYTNREPQVTWEIGIEGKEESWGSR